MIVRVLIAAYLTGAGLFVAGLMRAAGRRPWWEDVHDDLDALPITRKGPGADDSETLPPDDHETR